MSRLPLLLCLLLVAGCSRPSGSEPPQVPTSAAAPAEDVPLPGKLKFKDGDGRERFSLKPKDDGAKLVDGDERELARLKWKGASLKVSGPDDVALGYVLGSSGGALIVRDGEQKQVLYTLSIQGPGWRLTDAKGSLLYTVSPDDEGARVQDAQGAEVARVKVREGKVSLRDAQGKTTLSTHALVRADAAACLAFESVSLPLRVALLHQLQQPPSGPTP
ncbi:hypothetical protein LXT21_28675 [Myxococcus sp. K38C18041901]|uniref:hypothetical protein n=1 Tax=Myxococcus guangdongensis TaxID=2906760 RepID=UPI0020A763C5|nr:hypothetical protein [Myxococcus guangdongensis]MCP3062767.1 hypothetical protein [Myxococcus guangdongensis]